MRFLPTKIHGLTDYLMFILLMASPFIFWSTARGADTWVPMLLGASILVYSIWTDYEWGAFHSIPMRTHLMLDLSGGILLAVSPWLFGFADVVYLPHLVLGFAEVGMSLITKTEPLRKGMLGNDTL